MPYKDPERPRAAVAEYNRSMYIRIFIKVRKDSDVYTAIVQMQETSKTPLAMYTLSALREKLMRDGYLQTEE